MWRTYTPRYGKTIWVAATHSSSLLCLHVPEQATSHTATVSVTKTGCVSCSAIVATPFSMPPGAFRPEVPFFVSPQTMPSSEGGSSGCTQPNCRGDDGQTTGCRATHLSVDKLTKTACQLSTEPDAAS